LLQMVYYFKMKHDEIAAQLNYSHQFVRQKKKRCLDALRKIALKAK